MSRITKKDLERELKRLNDTFGFKGYKYTRLKTGKLKPTGKGFDLDSAYGGVSLVFMKAPSTGQRSISYRMTSKELYEYMQALRSGISMYKRRTKM
jgi:hypothetical protein